MNIKKFLAFAAALVLAALSLTACGTMDKTNGMSGEPGNAGEAAAEYKELMEKENAILSENKELWEKVFAAADKGMTMQEDGKNYGDFLLGTIDSAKDSFTADELTLLRNEAGKIRDIENKLSVLEKKYPEAARKSSDGDMSIPAENGTSIQGDSDSMRKFPAFEGKDLSGNAVKSEELFSANAVTVINFWFTTCGPCVGELSELDALDKELADKGGTLIGVNSFTLDGNESAISEAKDVLAKKGAAYRNIYFDSESEAGKFVEKVYAYPTTYVVDRSGSIVGEPIVGAVNGKAQMKKLKSLIDKVIADDKG